MLDKVLQLKQHLRLAPLDGERTFLISEREHFLLQGRAYALAVPLVDGRRTLANIVAALNGQASPPEVLYALLLLEKQGHAVAAGARLAPEAAAFWQSQGLDAGLAAERLAAMPVSVEGRGAGPVAGALRRAGLRVEREAPTRIVVVDDYRSADLDGWAQRARAERLRWAPCKPSGLVAWMGPMLGATGGPCWACLEHRLRANRPVETYLERRGLPGPFTPPRAELPASVEAAASFAALAVARWVVEGSAGSLDHHLSTLDLPRFAAVEHRVVRRPQCPTCGDGEMIKARGFAPVLLEHRPKRFTDDGGHRCVPPEETLARLDSRW